MIGSVEPDPDAAAERQPRAHERERGGGADDRSLTSVTSSAISKRGRQRVAGSGSRGRPAPYQLESSSR